MNLSRSHYFLQSQTRGRAHSLHCTLLCAFADVPWATVTHLWTTAILLWQTTWLWLADTEKHQSGDCGHRAAGVGNQTPQRGQSAMACWGSPSERLPEAPGSWEWFWRCHPHRKAAKAGTVWGRQRQGPRRLARAADQWFMLTAATEHCHDSMGCHRQGQAVTHNRAKGDEHWGQQPWPGRPVSHWVLSMASTGLQENRLSTVGALCWELFPSWQHQQRGTNPVM